MEEIRTPESIKKYLDLTQNAKSFPLATPNGLFGAITLVQSDNYLVAAHVIKVLFQLSPQGVARSLASFAPGNVILYLLAEVDNKSKANKASSS